MKYMFIFKRSSVTLFVLSLLSLGGGYYALQWISESQSTFKEEQSKKEFTIITTEYKSKTDDGKMIEVYRWNPGTIVVNEGDHVTLKFYGVQGMFHPFEIEKLGIKGEVKKGRETSVSFVAEKEGTYKIVCTAHADMQHNGPMVGYLIID